MTTINNELDIFTQQRQKYFVERYSSSDFSDNNTFEFLEEYITSKVVEWIIRDQGIGLATALLLFHNSQTFDKLCQRSNGMYIESPACVYEVFKHEQRYGTIRGRSE